MHRLTCGLTSRLLSQVLQLARQHSPTIPPSRAPVLVQGWHCISHGPVAIRHAATRHGLGKHTSIHACSTKPAADSQRGLDVQHGASLQPSRPAKTKARRKRRLDEVCSEQYPQHASNVLSSWITQGKVSVNGQVVSKAGTLVAETATITINAVEAKYVCRAGLKLEAALERFGIDVTGLVCLDAGLSTGGFTDCLLQHGAAHVFGVDVGYGQVAERVRVDPRVTVMERTNLRKLRLADLPFLMSPADDHAQQHVQLVTLDLSFISVLKVLPAVCDILAPDGRLIVLIKPQFEAARAQVGPGGVVTDPAVHQQVIQTVTEGLAAAGFQSHGCMESPIKGAAKGNTEFLGYFLRVA